MTGSKKIRIAIALVFAVAAWAVIAPFAARFLIVEKPLEKADAVFVLSGASKYKERAKKAAELYKAGIAPRIFLSDDGIKAGWSNEEERNPPFVDLAKGTLIEHGVTPEAIEILPGDARSTYSEAGILCTTIQNTETKSVLLVTSPYHTRRALGIFDKTCGAGAVLGIQSPKTGDQTANPNTWWLSPNGLADVFGEYVKLLYYSVSY